MAPTNQPTYHKDEKVFCFHHEILYEAKILEVTLSDPDDRKSPYEYRVHYKGWKNTYVSFLSPCYTHCLVLFPQNPVLLSQIIILAVILIKNFIFDIVSPTISNFSRVVNIFANAQ
jgi:hypothetical protein